MGIIKPNKASEAIAPQGGAQPQRVSFGKKKDLQKPTRSVVFISWVHFI